MLNHSHLPQDSQSTTALFCLDNHLPLGCFTVSFTYSAAPSIIRVPYFYILAHKNNRPEYKRGDDLANAVWYNTGLRCPTSSVAPGDEQQIIACQHRWYDCLISDGWVCYILLAQAPSGSEKLPWIYAHFRIKKGKEVDPFKSWESGWNIHDWAFLLSRLVCIRCYTVIFLMPIIF